MKIPCFSHVVLGSLGLVASASAAITYVDATATNTAGMGALRRRRD